AFGCLGALVLMGVLDGVSAMLAVAALAAAAAFAFALGRSETERRAPGLPRFAHLARQPGLLMLALLALALGNAAIYPQGLEIVFAKGRVETPDVVEHTQWNSYSRIRAEKIVQQSPAMWAASSAMPPVEIDQRSMNIDGEAGTTMFRFAGNPGEV